MDDIKQALRTDNRAVEMALVVLLARQTDDEQATHATREQNGVGFSAFDADIMTSMANRVHEGKPLTPKQLAWLRGRGNIAKYARQLDAESHRFEADQLDTMPAAKAAAAPKPNGAAPAPQQNPKRATLDGNTIRIYFPWSAATLAQVKSLKGRRFHGNTNPKHWSCPFSVEAVAELRTFGFAIDDALVTAAGTAMVEHAEKETELQKTIAKIGRSIPGLKKELFPFQPAGVEFLERHDGSILLADEQGLGKTVQILAYLALHPEIRPAIAVVPATAKWDWEAKAHEFLEDPAVEVLSGKAPYTPIEWVDGKARSARGRLLIINYDILVQWVDVLLELDPQFVCADEAQYAKNDKAQRTKALKRLAKGRRFTAISGTPGDNPREAYNAINMVDPNVFPSFWKYAQRYCGATHNGFGWDFSGATNVDELHDVLRNTIMIRRLKKDVLRELPDKVYNMVPLDMDAAGRKRYTNALERYRKNYGERVAELRKQMQAEGKSPQQIADRIKRAENAKALIELEGLKQAAAAAKLHDAIAWIRDVVEAGHKLVVFATHKEVIDGVMKAFGNIAVKVDGSVTGSKRWEAIERFQNDESCKLFVGNYRAAGVNVTLTAASRIAMLELPPRPTHLMQAEDRCHRIGQKNAVNVTYLVARGTIEEAIAHSLDKLRNVVSKMMDGEDVSEELLIAELLYNSTLLQAA